MPTLRFHGISREKALGFSEQLIKDLAIAFETEDDNISIEIVDSMFIRKGGHDVSPYPMVEIIAFERSEIIESQAAQAVTDALRDAGYEYSEIFYIHIDKENYYCNGECCE